PCHVLNVRLGGFGDRRPLGIRRPGAERGRGRRERTVTFGETGAVACLVFWRGALAGGQRVEGPAILEALDSTTVVPPGWFAETDADGFIAMRRSNCA